VFLSGFPFFFPTLDKTSHDIFFDLLFAVPSTAASTTPSAYIFKTTGTRGGLPINKSAFTAYQSQSVLGLGLIFTEESV
jgi:hypothetical protein